ncbi:hypothetical protein Pfo_020779 [Paulownia fortunei]|nr:hypothetical protein Pfo_020779 [Paulownia fortunei]
MQIGGSGAGKWWEESLQKTLISPIFVPSHSLSSIQISSLSANSLSKIKTVRIQRRNSRTRHQSSHRLRVHRFTVVGAIMSSV